MVDTGVYRGTMEPDWVACPLGYGSVIRMVFLSATQASSRQACRASARGLTLVEMGLVIAIIGILAGAAMLFMDLESGAAAAVDAELGSLEAVVKQGSSLTGNAPNSAAVITGAETYLESHLESGSRAVQDWSCNGGAATCTLQLTSGQTATYSVNANGVVSLTAITGFTKYQIGALGRIERI